jgi:hypothetical protein
LENNIFTSDEQTGGWFDQGCYPDKRAKIFKSLQAAMPVGISP